MVRILDVPMIAQIARQHGIETLIRDIMERLQIDFSNWENFQHIPRPAFYSKEGVIEVMPVCDKEKFIFKCVNGHPNNPSFGKHTVAATGQLADMKDGYPLLITEMTLITAIRTAAISALASNYLARQNSQTLAIIGTGAQSEYQVIAHKLVRRIKNIRYFDIDKQAMVKFETNISSNLGGSKTTLFPCQNAREALLGADIVVVCTACKGHQEVIKDAWVTEGQHINGLGGDCPGKTELQKSILRRARVVVEFFRQGIIEGEIQQFKEEEAKKIVDAHLFEIVKQEKKGRQSDSEITVFDSVGIALEDFSALSVIYDLAKKYAIGHRLTMIPDVKDPKDIFSLLRQ